LFVSISQVIGCEDRLQNDLDYVLGGVKLYYNSSSIQASQHPDGRNFGLDLPLISKVNKICSVSYQKNN